MLRRREYRDSLEVFADNLARIIKEHEPENFVYKDNISEVDVDDVEGELFRVAPASGGDGYVILVMREGDVECE